MRLLTALLTAVLLLLMVAGTVAADDWDDFVAEFGAMPPPPPNADNTDEWTDPLGTSQRQYIQSTSDDGGTSIQDMNAEQDIDDWNAEYKALANSTPF